MRAFAAAALAALALTVAGCGSSPAAMSAGAGLGADAVHLVPADAVAFVSVDTDGASAQRRQLDELTRDFPARDHVLQELRAALATRGLDYKRDVEPALGHELDLAVGGAEHGKPDVIALAQPADESKLRTLAAKFDSGNDHYTVEHVGDWSVVADSAAAFAAVRAAQGGRSLADTSGYVEAQRELGGDALAHAYVSARGLDALPKTLHALLMGSPAWAAVRLSADSTTLRASAALGKAVGPAPYAATLLRDVPSGAILAVSFKNADALVGRLHSPALARLASLLAGEGVLYVKPSGLVPEIAVELAPHDPQAALRRARALLRGSAAMLGPVSLTARLQGKKLVIADTPAAFASLRGGAKLVDDQPFKDALHAAGVPERTSGLLYADVSQLAPLLQLLRQSAGGKPLAPDVTDTLGRIGPILAWISRGAGVSRADVWIRRR